MTVGMPLLDTVNPAMVEGFFTKICKLHLIAFDGIHNPQLIDLIALAVFIAVLRSTTETVY